MKKIIIDTVLIRWKTSQSLISKNEKIDLPKAFGLIQKKFQTVEYEPSQQIKQIILRHNNFTYVFFSTGKVMISGKSIYENHAEFLGQLFEDCLKDCVVKKIEKPKLTQKEINKMRANIKENQRIMKRLEFI